MSHHSKRPKSVVSHLPLPIAGLSCGHQSFADTAPIRPSVFHSTLKQSSRFMTNSSLSFQRTSGSNIIYLIIYLLLFLPKHCPIPESQAAIAGPSNPAFPAGRRPAGSGRQTVISASLCGVTTAESLLGRWLCDVRRISWFWGLFVTIKSTELLYHSSNQGTPPDP